MFLTRIPLFNTSLGLRPSLFFCCLSRGARLFVEACSFVSLQVNRLRLLTRAPKVKTTTTESPVPATEQPTEVEEVAEPQSTTTTKQVRA